VAIFSAILSADIDDPELTMLAVIFAGTFRLMWNRNSLARHEFLTPPPLNPFRVVQLARSPESPS
jgi:hypothetical protein